MFRKKLLPLMIICLMLVSFFHSISVKAAGALIVDDLTTKTKAELVNKLMGNGITVSNISYTGKGEAAGLFTGGDGIIGFNDGIILSTGLAKGVVGPNDTGNFSNGFDLPGDKSLDDLFKGESPTYDAAALEFDFIPSTDTISFQYVLSSDEYNEYSDEYSDLFGLFVNGKNAAYLPTNPPEVVAITNVKKDKNSEYFINNDIDENKAHLNTQMDGLTVVLTAQANVIKGETNHMKFAIADYKDDLLDSNVFIKAGSFKAVNPGHLGFDNASYNTSGDKAIATVKVNRVNGSDGAVSAKWSCTSGKTEPSSGIVSFADGETSKDIKVELKFGEKAVLTLSDPTGGAVIDDKNKDIALYAPVSIINVTSSKANGTYGADEKILITTQFNGIVNLKNALPLGPEAAENIPKLLLNSGGSAAYVSGSGTDTLTFEYIVKDGEESKDLNYVSTSSLQLGTSTLVDASNMNASIVLPALDSKNSLGGNKDIVIHTVKAPNIIVTPSSKDFGTVTVGNKSSQIVFTVTNNGDAPLNLNAITITGADASNFKLINNNLSNITLLPNESRTFEVIFEPSSKGSKTASVTITSNDPDSANLLIPLTGNAAQAVATLPQTGTMIDTQILVFLGLLFISGGILIIIRNRRKAE